MKAPESPKHSVCKAIALFIFLLVFSLPQTVSSQQLAFPSAKGAGAYTIGGRGGQVIHVTTLNWSGPGSLKAALQTPGPRTIVFDVSGEIVVTEDYFELYGQYSNFTLAGQTAPHGGITIRTGYFSLTNVNNAIIRYIRFRDKGTPANSDAVWYQQANNVIFDHCSFSHGQDECLDISYSQGVSGNVTIQNCIFTDSKTGALLGIDSSNESTNLPDLGDFTFINNVFANISHRFPNPQGNGHYDIINNIVYNWKERLIRTTQGGTYNIINNYYKTSVQGLRRSGWYPGSSNLTVRLHKMQIQLGETPLVHAKGSLVTGQRMTPQANDSDMFQYFTGSHSSYPQNTQVGSQFFTNTQFPLAGNGFTIKPASQAYTDVLNDVGANKTLNADGTHNNYQDTKDTADILMIQNDSFVSYASNDFAYTPINQVPYPTIPSNTRPSGFYVSNPHIPEAWFLANVPAGQNHNSIAPSGYTWLEVYLNSVDNSNTVIGVESIVVTPGTAELEVSETVQLTATFTPSNATNQNGIWSSSNTSIATVTASGLVMAVSSGDVIITFTTADGNFTDTSEIIVLPESITANAGQDTAICQGDSVTLTASGGATYLWSTGATTASITVSPSTTTTYTVTAYGASGNNSDTDDVVVTVNTPPIANAGDDIATCLGTPVTLTASGGSSYLWNNGQTTQSITVNPNTTTTYSVEVTQNGCISTDQVIVTVNPLPVINAGNDVTILEGDSITLTATGGTSYVWSNGATTQSITVSPTETTTFTVTGISNGCQNTDSVTVFLVDDSVTANAGQDTTVCQGESTTLTATGGFSYLWSTGATTASIIVNPSMTTTYTVTAYSVSGNNSDTDEVIVTVNPLPTISAGNNVTIMSGQTVTLSASGGTSYVWNTGATTQSISVSPTTTTTYTVTGSANGCQNTDTVTVFVENETVIANAGENETICQGYSTTLTATGGNTYLWSTGATTQSITVSPNATSTYTVTVFSGNAQDSDDVTVFVNPNPNVVITNGDEVMILQGEFITLSATGANTYLWNNGATQPNIAVSPANTTTFSVTGFINNCQDQKEVQVNVLERVNAEIQGGQSVCLSESIVLTAVGNTNAEYLWSTGEVTQSITVSPTEDTEYSVTVYNALDYDTAEMMVTVTDCSVINPEEPETFEFLVYPNPTSGELNIKINGLLNVASIYIYDVSGKSLYYEKINENEQQSYIKQLNVSSFASGVYFLKLVDDTSVITKKIIVN